MISNKPQIAISLRIVKAENYDETRDALSHDWPKLLEELGLVPIYIPNKLSDIMKYLSNFQINGIILSGGDNLGKDPERDDTEKELLQHAISKKIPTLGICRGLQLINEHFGGSLTKNQTNSHIGKNHELDVVNEKFRKILNCKKIITNSFHKNTILNSDLSKYLRPIATHTVDKTVEAAFHETLPIVGLMWHPERNSDKFDKQIISSIFKKTVFQNNLS